ncbi:putative carboxypeptidase B [Apostichopus japonicus]|uniref:Putative carboxypeptidase B n=1 Tax=Stichopus japonicus TaxID=307972 RepID=A0A2G8KL65_STIJA|nr:putative carboxypeptidase B [Apostichopus japonicus]
MFADNGYKTYNLHPKYTAQLEFLRNLEHDFDGSIDFWTDPNILGRSVDIMIPPHLQSSLEDLFRQHGIDYSIGLEDVQDAIEKAPSTAAVFDYNKYNTFDNIVTWMTDFASANSDIVTEFNVGVTFEGRNIKGIKIGENQGSSKKAVYYEGGIHAREWISPATVINIARSLVDDYRTGNADVKEMLETFDYYIVPVLNADGYAHTYANGGDRLWRKNRNSDVPGRCTGVDLNRNWPYQWEAANGVSDNSCGITYRGPTSGSELEIQAITNFLVDEQREWVGFIDFHAYSQLVLSPWSYSKVASLPADSDVMVDAGTKAATALKAVYNTEYTVGPSARTLYAASGCSEDWGYAVLGAQYSYVVELRPTGDPPGFLLPEDEIEPSGIETYELVKSFGLTYLGR